MERIKIVEKLNNFLDKHVPFTEECHVVYMLVEIRKILDLNREHNHKYPMLRFYCDWSVHTNKDNITKEMKIVMKDIYEDIKKEITNPALVGMNGERKIISFIYMKDLKVEMKSFLQEYRLLVSLTGESNWLKFIELLVKILVDQPINNPSPDVRQFTFLSMNDGCVWGKIYFNKNIGQIDNYSFGNIY